MKDELREPVGFLCRWLLLTLVAAVTGAVAWSSISATMAMGTNVRTRCLVPDLLIRPAGSFTLNGYLFPPPKHSESMVGIWCWPDGSVSFAQAREHVFHIWHTTGGRTVLPVTFRGIPYGATAFQTVLSVVRLVPADRKVVLVDAALADGRAKAGTGSFGRLLTAARARGETAMFYSGPLSDFGEARAKLGADRPDVPLLAGWDRKRR
ncbi:MAG TPA: hypothetical protein DCX07_11730, partial [Phycisphaerales bacterium]|nr:hypothetical protein [Phycisphaerales bacterium]